MERKILLLCAAGMSTSLLVTKMLKAAEEKGIQIIVDACPVEKFQEKLNEYDIFLLGPQVRFKQEDFSKIAEEVKKKSRSYKYGRLWNYEWKKGFRNNIESIR